MLRHSFTSLISKKKSVGSLEKLEKISVDSSVSILDFVPFGTASSPSKESRIFCSILLSILATEWMKKSDPWPSSVPCRHFHGPGKFSSQIAPTVTEDPKQRAKLIKQWVKIANKCWSTQLLTQ